jgi:hypothetical protein
MAWKKPINCDSSDIGLWARHTVAHQFEREINEHRDKSLRSLIKKPTEESAAEVRAFDRVVSLLEEARKLH